MDGDDNIPTNSDGLYVEAEIVKFTCGCYSNSACDSDNDDTVVCLKKYSSYMCNLVCSSGSDSYVTKCNHINLEYKLYQSVLQTFGWHPTYNYMPDIETEDAYYKTKDDTDMDDYKITGEPYDFRHLRQNKNYQLNFDAARRE
jgi:hypothetical protein